MAKVEGIGIHSGRRVSVWLHRAPGPIRFLSAGVEIPARVANVSDTARATTLAHAGASVTLVEHLLAALRIAGFFEGVLVEVAGSELPILDGSAGPWAEAVSQLGPPAAPPPPLTLSKRLVVERGGGRASAEPGTEALVCEIDFAHPAIGHQVWSGGPQNYGEVLDARTFGFLSELAGLRERGLALGATLEHAIVFADEGPVRPLRSADEPVRHKALDAIGDLSLLGRPLAGAVSIVRGSHALHHQLMIEVLELAHGQRQAGAV